MSRSIVQARALVDGLIQGGVRWLVISPGSRSAPLVYAAAQAEAAGRLECLVRIDERVAGFVAIGLTWANAGTVALVCTSGTAAANYHPAVLEASHSALPLVVLTADRPPELQGVGANQTTDQVGLYAGAVRASFDPQIEQGAKAWRAAGRQAALAALGLRSAWPGPVHINTQFREPLVPETDWYQGSAWPEEADAGAQVCGQSSSWRGQGGQLEALELARGPNTLVVAGAGAGPAARTLAEQAGWPLLAEPESGSWGGPMAITAGRLLVGQPPGLDIWLGQEIERLVIYGRPVLTRPITAIATGGRLEVIGVHSGGGPWFDQGRAAQLLAGSIEVPGEATAGENAWLKSWRAAGLRAWAAVEQHLAAKPLSGPLVAAAVTRALSTDPLVVSSSSAVRDLDLTPPTGGSIYALRGLAGIDGTVSAATGLALGLGRPVTALLGDLALLHDCGGLAVGSLERVADLRLVVLNDQGGSIFEALEVGREGLRPVFERYFATPQNLDLTALATSFGADHHLAGSLPELEVLLAGTWSGRQIIELRLERSIRHDLEKRLRQAAARALANEK
ncbi:MAG: 2-succinyl-5-enolpyruvyl-6-hydroxy-3-cyclohexene-1-carboxylic-acid synthase [Micrococcales bacterium]|nr:2-succinyl-5-enolpyruvyl-6-hydroxy-3-cyclohexene-1-carboxylic-acid synthase [Micrococcales bacterium]